MCCLCKIKQGAPIQCQVKTCKVAFHVTCAFEHKLDMRTEVDEEDEEDEESANVHLQVRCLWLYCTLYLVRHLQFRCLCVTWYLGMPPADLTYEISYLIHAVYAFYLI